MSEALLTEEFDLSTVTYYNNEQLKKAQKVYCWENQELKLFNLIGEQTS